MSLFGCLMPTRERVGTFFFCVGGFEHYDYIAVYYACLCTWSLANLFSVCIYTFSSNWVTYLFGGFSFILISTCSRSWTDSLSAIPIICYGFQVYTILLYTSLWFFLVGIYILGTGMYNYPWRPLPVIGRKLDDHYRSCSIMEQSFLILQIFLSRVNEPIVIFNAWARIYSTK